MRKEENWSHFNVKREVCFRSFDVQKARINKNLGINLTGEQHTALMLLARYRHYLHSSRESYLLLDDDFRDKLRSFFLNKLGVLLRSTGLPALNLRYFLIDNTESAVLRTVYIDELNHQIETYLYDIDKIYRTMYCPTGFRRMKRSSGDSDVLGV